MNVPENEDQNWGVAYSQFVVPLVKAVQELNAVKEAQHKEIEKQHLVIEQLLQRIEKLETRLTSN